MRRRIPTRMPSERTLEYGNDCNTEPSKSEFFLSAFGVGFETNNFFDHSLLWDTDALPQCGEEDWLRAS